MPTDNPGAPGQPSRLESLARAREAQQQRIAQNAEGTGGSGAQPGEARDGRPAAPQEVNRADKPQPAGQTELGGAGWAADTEEHDGREAARGENGRPLEESLTNTTSGGVLGGEAPGDRHQPATQSFGEQGGSPTPDAERLRDQEHPLLAGEGNAAASSDSGTLVATEQESQGADQQDDDRARPEPSAQIGDQATGPAGMPPDTTHGTQEPSGRDAPSVREAGTSPEASDQLADSGRADPEVPEPTGVTEPGAEQPAGRPQDRSGSEQLGEAATGTNDRGTTGDAQTGGEAEGTRPGSETGQPTEPYGDYPANRRRDETTGQGTDTHEPHTAGEAPASETGDARRTTDTALSSPEETGETPGTREQRAEREGDGGSSAEDDGTGQLPKETSETNPEVSESADESGAPTRDSTQTNQRGELGRELAPHETEPVETEPGRFNGHIRMTVDNDGRPLPERHPGAGSDTPGRGELRDPEDDPEHRDYRDSGPEKPSKRLDLAREAFAEADNIKDSIDKLTDPAQKHLERVQPTGQTCGARPSHDHIRAEDSQLQIGNAAIGIFTAAVLAMEAGRAGVEMIRKLIRRNNDRNR
jgi:hypothetical protein